MEDVSPGLLKQIQELFAEDVASIRESMKSGHMTYEEAYGAAFEIGSALSKAFDANINAEILPDGRMYYNIANKVVLPMLKEEHDLVSQAAVQAQKNANRAAGIGIRPLEAEFDADRAQGIIDRVSSQPFEKVSWLLDEPVKSFAKNVVDHTLEKNVEFQGKSGLHPKIVRRASAGACPWCLAVAGSYSYPDVPGDVYRRHANCDCVVEYMDGGKIQDVHSKVIYQSEDERIDAIQKRIDKANKRRGIRLSPEEKINKATLSLQYSGGRILDIDGDYEREWAARYYEEIRHKSTDCKKIAEKTGRSEQTIQNIKKYVFFEGKWYNPITESYEQFVPDAAIAQSWQRLAEGKPQPFDLLLIDHEEYEMRLKADNPGISHDEAHRLASQQYDYQGAAEEYYAKIRERRKNR